jgi:hypothetical protein
VSCKILNCPGRRSQLGRHAAGVMQNTVLSREEKPAREAYCWCHAKIVCIALYKSTDHSGHGPFQERPAEKLKQFFLNSDKNIIRAI